MWQWRQANVVASDDLGEFALQVKLPGIDCLPACLPGWAYSMRLHFPLTVTFAFRTPISQFALALALTFRIRISHALFHSLCLPSAFIKSNCENLFAISIRSHVGCQLAGMFRQTNSSPIPPSCPITLLASVASASKARN